MSKSLAELFWSALLDFVSRVPVGKKLGGPGQALAPGEEGMLSLV